MLFSLGPILKQKAYWYKTSLSDIGDAAAVLARFLE